MQRKTYTIGSDVFYLKDDLTVEESESVQELIDGLYEQEQNNRSGSISRCGIKKFLALVLEPAGCSRLQNETDFGKAKESVVLDVIKDFFLRRMRLTVSITDYFRSLTRGENAPPES